MHVIYASMQGIPQAHLLWDSWQFLMQDLYMAVRNLEIVMSPFHKYVSMPCH